LLEHRRIVQRINLRGIDEPGRPASSAVEAVPRVRWNSSGSIRLILRAFVVQM
jgi:hypothetical protein